MRTIDQPGKYGATRGRHAQARCTQCIPRRAVRVDGSSGHTPTLPRILE